MIGATTVEKLGKLFPLLASNHDGEVVATARAIRRILEKNGSSLHELAGAIRPRATFGKEWQSKPVPKRKAAARKKAAAEPVKSEPIANPAGNLTGVFFQDVILCGTYLLSLGTLNDKEMDFVAQLRKWARSYREKFKITEKQEEWWVRLLVEHEIVPAAGSEGGAA